jgi:hypothetical protein
LQLASAWRADAKAFFKAVAEILRTDTSCHLPRCSRQGHRSPPSKPCRNQPAQSTRERQSRIKPHHIGDRNGDSTCQRCCSGGAVSREGEVLVQNIVLGPVAVPETRYPGLRVSALCVPTPPSNIPASTNHLFAALSSLKLCRHAGATLHSLRPFAAGLREALATAQSSTPGASMLSRPIRS